MRKPSRAAILSVALAASSLLTAPAAIADQIIEGRVTVVRDVDTIVVSGTPVK